MRIIAIILFLYPLALAGVEGPVAAEPGNPLGLRLYAQEFEIEYASAADAAKASLEPTPVQGGKAWAFSARWDDNHANDFPMREAMSRHGLRGTFYLNHSTPAFGAAEARRLVQDGCDIGGHTQTHPALTALLPNLMFYEILANRVEREAQTDHPINSFAFPCGLYETPTDPSVGQVVTQAVIRAGFHNSPYLGFARKNPALRPFEVSTGHQVSPGDHQVDRAGFDKQMQRILGAREERSKDSYLIHMGVHARQTGKALEEVESVFTTYAGRADWWYCSMTQYAAYDRQFRNSRITELSGHDAVRRYRILRPLPAECGDDAPLTIEVRNAAVVAVRPEGFACDTLADPVRKLLDLCHAVGRMVPTRIDVVDNPTNAAEPPAGQALADFPDLQVWLSCDSGATELRFTIRNPGKEPLSAGWVVLRLPPSFVDGVQRVPVPAIAAGETRVIVRPLGPQREELRYREGRAYLVAEWDFRSANDSCRVFATTRLPDMRGPACLRDAAWMLGPFAEGDLTAATLLAQSVAGVRLEDQGTTPDRRWFASNADDRSRYGSERVVAYQNDRAWKAAAGKLDYKPQCYLVAADFTLSQVAPLRLLCEGVPLAVLLNGRQVAPGAAMDGAQQGGNRLLIMLKMSDNRAAWGAFPIFLRVQPAAGTLTYLPVPPRG